MVTPAGVRTGARLSRAAPGASAGSPALPLILSQPRPGHYPLFRAGPGGERVWRTRRLERKTEQERKTLRAHRVFRARRVFRVHRVLRAHRISRGHRILRAHRILTPNPASKVRPVLSKFRAVQRPYRELRARRPRDWISVLISSFLRQPYPGSAR